jgi:hypothetical protein
MVRVLIAVALATALTSEVASAADCSPWYIVSPGVCRRDCVEWNGWSTRAYSEYKLCGTFTGSPAQVGAPVAIIGSCTQWYPDNTVLGLCRRECWDGWRVRTEYKMCSTLQVGEIDATPNSPNGQLRLAEFTIVGEIDATSNSPNCGSVTTQALVSRPYPMRWRRLRCW